MTAVPTTEIGEREGEGLVGVLAFVDGPLAGQEVVVEGEATIGRGPECTVVLPASEMKVSAHHASVRVVRRGFRMLEDAGSSGGTFLNDTRLRSGGRAALRSADVIQLGVGGPRLRFRLRSPQFKGAAPTDTYGIVLTVARGRAEHPRLHFTNQPLVTIGRDPTCDVVLASDGQGALVVSKRHARILFKGRDFVLEDLGSANGTLVGGEVVNTVTLREGDIIEIGAGGPTLVVERLELPGGGTHELVAEVRRDSRNWRFIAIGAAVAALAAAGLAWTMVGNSEGVPAAAAETEDAPAPSEVEVFKALKRRHESAVLFVYSRFELHVDGIDEPVFAGETFGSGFVVLQDGHAITNRHVVEPWRGDPVYAFEVLKARRTHGEDAVRIVQEVAAWPEGTVALTEARGVEFTSGYNSHVLHNLGIVGFPPLHTREVEYEGERVELMANDHTDLALLQLQGLELPAEAIPPLAPADHLLEPLDPVVSFGYPRGDVMLEGTNAALSATRGTVSKIQSTIQLNSAVYPGNSGGPVFDLHGEVVGITTRRGGENLAVCIPARMAHALLREHVAGL